MNSPLTQSHQLHSTQDPVFTLDATTKLQGRWTHHQHLLFLNAIIRYGKDWKKVQQQVADRTGPQVRSHAQKYFLKINKIIKDRKKIKGKKMPDITDTELQLKQYFALHPLTVHTPKEIIELLKIEKVGIKNLIEQNCNGNQLQIIQQLLAPTIKPQKNKVEKTKIPSPSVRIIDGIQNQTIQSVDNQSFFASIMQLIFESIVEKTRNFSQVEELFQLLLITNAIQRNKRQ